MISQVVNEFKSLPWSPGKGKEAEHSLTEPGNCELFDVVGHGV